MPTQPVIAVQDLRKKYDQVEAVKGIDFQRKDPGLRKALGAGGAGAIPGDGRVERAAPGE